MAEINNHLKALIIGKFGTQADFAEELKIDEPTISRIVRGRRELSPEELAQWASALDCKPADIIPEERS